MDEENKALCFSSIFKVSNINLKKNSKQILQLDSVMIPKSSQTLPRVENRAFCRAK